MPRKFDKYILKKYTQIQLFDFENNKKLQKWRKLYSKIKTHSSKIAEKRFIKFKYYNNAKNIGEVN